MRNIKFKFEGIKYSVPETAMKRDYVRLPDGVMLKGNWIPCTKKDCKLKLFVSPQETSKYGFPFVTKYTNAELAYQE